MSKDPTARDMLNLYRLHQDEFMEEQASQVRQLSQEDAVELLFLMSVHQTQLIQFLHSKIDPEGAVTVGMPTEGTEVS